MVSPTVPLQPQRIANDPMEVDVAANGPMEVAVQSNNDCKDLSQHEETPTQDGYDRSSYTQSDLLLDAST